MYTRSRRRYLRWEEVDISSCSVRIAPTSTCDCFFIKIFLFSSSLLNFIVTPLFWVIRSLEREVNYFLEEMRFKSEEADTYLPFLVWASPCPNTLLSLIYCSPSHSLHFYSLLSCTKLSMYFVQV